MTLIKNLVIAVVGLMVALFLYGIVKQQGVSFSQTPQSAQSTSTVPSTAVHNVVYRNNTYGLQFVYPEGYVMQEVATGTPQGTHHSIILVREEESVPPENGEGPPAISIDIYRDNPAPTLFEWLQTDASNFKLSNGTSASTTISGVEAIQYHWSGLYEGDTTAFLHGEDIVAVSVTYIVPEDENVAVYKGILQSLQLR